MSVESFKPLVSIVIPVYNGSRYLAQAIDSALAQTYKNIEILVVNDGSNDNCKTRKVALSYGDKIRYFEKKNGGVSTALNLGIDNMRGEYFSWLSHDDLYLPDKIQIQINILSQEEQKDAIIYGNYDLIDENSKVFASFNASAKFPKEKLGHSLYPLLRGLTHGCSLLIHKSHFERVGLFDEKLRTASDYDLWFKIFRDSKLIYYDGILVKNRCHAEQQVHYSTTHVAECNWLWSYMVDRLTTEEMREMSGSEYQFYRTTAEFLKETPYTEAQRHVQALADNVREKISVVIPFYNRIPLVLEAVKSVLNQTYENFEILLIDDGSTEDPTPVKKFASLNSRISYFRIEHAGVSSARNFGISRSSGDYIAFLDSDDMFAPEKLEKQLSFMKAHDLYFSHTSYTRIDQDGNPAQFMDAGVMSGKAFPRILASCGIQTSTVMARREVFQRHRFKEEIGMGEDVCLWIDISYEYSIGGIRESLTIFRLGDTTSALSKECQKLGYFNILQHILKNPKYASQEYYIHLLLKDYANVFYSKAAPIVFSPAVSPSFTPLIEPVQAKGFFRRHFRVIDWGVRLAISLINVGPKITCIKIYRKVRSKFMPQSTDDLTTPTIEKYAAPIDRAKRGTPRLEPAIEISPGNNRAA
jgi:glycosyltransferase involved in cell wall biosynthesis